jgi:hypothetical protein
LGVPVVPASFGGQLGQLAGRVFGPAQALAEAYFLTWVRADAVAAGIPLQGVDLLPMRLHDNDADFRSVGFLAWTNSSSRVYVNILGFIDIFNNSTTGALAETRATAIYVMRHEANHVTQFKGNGDKPPASFAAMTTFEEQAYGGDETWLKGAQVQNLLLNTIGTSQAVVDALVDNAKDNKAAFNAFNNDPSLTTDAQRRDAMKRSDFLPKAVRGNASYKVADLYRTKAP